MKSQKRNEYDKTESVAKEVLYWTTVLIIIIATLLVSVVLVPLIIVLSPAPLYAITLLLGIIFGALFTLLIHDIKGLHLHHHVLALLFLPGISLLNFLVVGTIAARVGNFLNISLTIDPLVIALVYSIALLLPYFLTGEWMPQKKQ